MFGGLGSQAWGCSSCVQVWMRRLESLQEATGGADVPALKLDRVRNDAMGVEGRSDMKSQTFSDCGDTSVRPRRHYDT